MSKSKGCYKCPDRFRTETTTCHTTCPDYQERVRKNEEIRIKRRKEQDAYYKLKYNDKYNPKTH